MFGDIRLHVAIQGQSVLFDIIPHSIRPSSLHSPSYFHFRRPPSYVGLLSFQSPSVDHLCDFPYCLLILSFLILSSFVTRSSHVSATPHVFSCAVFTAHVSAPCIIAGLTSVLLLLHTFPLIFMFISPRHNHSGYSIISPAVTPRGHFCIQFSIIRQLSLVHTNH